MKRTIYYPKQLLWFIVLHFCIDVHSCFAVFVSGKVLDGLWINTSIEKIGNVSVPQLMRGYIKVQRISDFGLIFLGHAQRWGRRALGGVLYLALFCTMLALLLQNVGQKYASPASASILMSTESVFGILFSVLFAGEVVTPRLAVGFALIFAAVLVSEVQLPAKQAAKK